MGVSIRKITREDKSWVYNFLINQAGAAHMVSRSVLYQCDELPGFIAAYAPEEVKDKSQLAAEDVGLLTYHVHGRQFQVVTLHTAVQRQGIGSALLKRGLQEARQQQCHRLWLITTNDNEPAIQFYQRFGCQLTAVHKGAITKSRKIKPEIPLTGLNGIPIEDEIEFEIQLRVK
jgi:ribosomal protein S18 acetylase RimI-like enzyme